MINFFYASVAIKKSHHKYLKFKFNNKLYKFKVLPNGYCEDPRRFTKLMKVPLSILRKLEIIIAAYIDDLFTQSKSWETCLRNILIIAQLLISLGFHLNLEKSLLDPSHVMEFLGVIINSLNMTITLTVKKKECILLLSK